MGCARFVCRGLEGSLLSFFSSLDEDFETSSPVKWFYIGWGFFSISCTGVVFMAPSMIRRAMF